ncbi:MAG: mRNA interferase RelE/StbE [Acidobacteriota bacterium]|jgi:mRNA-degrading endonuclease RelE of RelBE toxin-antitoxin system|nr:mRNA interferase RelE/StbE [Acidobacteriota bacterium]
MFEIEFTEGAIGDLRFLEKAEQRYLLEAIERQLPSQPLTPTRNRKLLRANELSEWELRVGDLRVFYDVDEEYAVVRIKAVGRKDRNRLFIRGKEFLL